MAALRFCPSCEREVPAFADGPRGRPNARCPLCQSLERHRYLAVLLRALSKEVSRTRRVLEIAPTRAVTRMLRYHSPGSYVGIDIDPNADGRRVQVVADLTSAPFRSGSFDLSVCFHVFEHIPDDRSAMAEYARLMARKGIGFIQNPWRPRGPTDEDPSASPEERLRRFGQADHVRIYGEDFEARLASAGIKARRVHPEDILSGSQVEQMSLGHAPVWIAHSDMTLLAHLSDRRYKNKLRKRLRGFR